MTDETLIQTIKKLIFIIAVFGFLLYIKGGQGVFFENNHHLSLYPPLIIGIILILISVATEESMTEEIIFYLGKISILGGFFLYIILWIVKYWFGVI